MEDVKVKQPSFAVEKGKKYRLRLRQAQLTPFAVTQVPADLSEKMGKPNQVLVTVGLSGIDAEQKIPGDSGQSPRTVTVPGATQAQLKYIFEQGNDLIEEYEDKKRWPKQLT